MSDVRAPGDPRYSSGERIDLTISERRWLKRKWERIRASQSRADSYGNDWNRISAEISEYLDRKGIEDLVQRTKIKSESIPLKDALEGGKWHAAEASRHTVDVQLFLQLKSLGVL
jgi:hypothetical protein